MVVTREDNPPTYDVAMSSSGSTSPPPASPTIKKDTPYQPIPQQPPQPVPHHGMIIASGPSSVPLYRYHNPTTGEVVTSLLPPDHPEMICLQQGHVVNTRYGILGILAAVFWFPLGVGLCLLDRRTKCDRCGLTIEEGCF
ncbi:hypothetical protein RhiJN_22007 [Ceratobasidium sp. AG-Ba]|nr:hypothetical protein RhiJN_07356 [Ceratobasidium sp. AG-Ba]QRV93989.1 hypothetical protein RhiJN_22007 [Ceratobasidium sp. AG-Ba]